MHLEEITPAGDDIFLPNALDRWAPVGDSVCSWPDRNRSSFCGRDAILVLGELNMPYGLHVCFSDGCQEWRMVRDRELCAARRDVVAAVRDAGGSVRVWSDVVGEVSVRNHDFRPARGIPSLVWYAGIVVAVIVFVVAANMMD